MSWAPVGAKKIAKKLCLFNVGVYVNLGWLLPLCFWSITPPQRVCYIGYFTGSRQCVVCNAADVKWLLDPRDQGWAVCPPLIGGESRGWPLIGWWQWPHIRHPGEVRAANTCQQKSPLTPLQYNNTAMLFLQTLKDQYIATHLTISLKALALHIFYGFHCTIILRWISP